MDRLYFKTVAVPAGTPQAAPVDAPLALEDAQLRGMDITIPDGHNGLTGLRILWSGQQIVPWGNNSFIVANNRTIHVDFNDYITISGVVFEAFNTDVFAHSFYIELTITDDKTRAGLMATPSGSPAVVS